MWDLAIVGAGPAGTAAALSALRARPDAKVLLLDRVGFPRDKVCGDGIAPHALDVLAGLGVGDAAVGYPPVHDLRIGFPQKPCAAARMRRPARVVPRQVFDARLVEAAVGRGAVLRQHRVRRVDVHQDRVLLDGDIAARVVIGADGARSAVRRTLGIAPTGRTTTAVALRGYAPATRDGQVIVFGEAAWPSYAWSFPIGDGSANVGYGELLGAGGQLTRNRMLERLEALLPGATHGGTGWRAHHLPLSTGRPRQPGGRALLAGDAM
ncbi:MAG: NAD(P)/FAD-dependent oxidoreductase, partial [Pseudonocardia sp.]